MERWRAVLTLQLWTVLVLCSGREDDKVNLPPNFTQVIENLPLMESTPVGEVVFTLQGSDPEGLPVKYGLVGTKRFTVNPQTGDITLVQPLDREEENKVQFFVSIEDEVPGATNNLVQVPVTIIILDENDNPPEFTNSPYEVDVPEDEQVGKTILKNIIVEDKDSVGDNLEVGCVANERWIEACEIFEVVTMASTSNYYMGALVLKKSLDYNLNQFYQFQLLASDGSLNSTAPIEVKVEDVQNSPPIFSGSLSAALSEDTPVGTLALTIKARDGDRAQPRNVSLELLNNPLEYFLLDSVTGELRTAKPLDREALIDPSSPLNITVRASEVDAKGLPIISSATSSLATVTITIKDVNDEPPRFNRKEYSVEVPENLPFGTPLPNLDMFVTDTDLGSNSVFTLRLSDETSAFIVEPEMASGSASVTLRLNSTLDYEDPNQRKFILEVIAEELHTSPRLSSKCSVTVTVTDVNDNAPAFTDAAYSAEVLENAPAHTIVAVVTATDRDSGRFGSDSIVYRLSGSGSELFFVSRGVITVNGCLTPSVTPCLDFETRKDYYLQYEAVDNYGEGQKTVVPLQISLLDYNDNPPVFTTAVYKASIDEDAVKFEPELQVQARDADVTSEIRYAIIQPETHPFAIDSLTGRIFVRQDSGSINAEDNQINLTVLATDGVYNTTCRVEVTVRDVNNHAPVFHPDSYDADLAENAPLGTQVAVVKASDLDSGQNAEIEYKIQKGALDAFEIDSVTGVITVSSTLDYDKRNTYRIQIIASDMGMPSLTGTAELTVHIIDVNDKKPYFNPIIQRAEVSADAELGSEVHKLTAEDPDVADSNLLVYELARDNIIKAVDKNGKEVTDEGIFGSWFEVMPNGSVVVAQKLDRSRAAVITIPVRVTDTSAVTPSQQADGELSVTIVDVNRQAPLFSLPSYWERLVEEQPAGTILGTFTATDREGPISAVLIHPPSAYFEIDNATGVVKTTQPIDYEQVHWVNFTLVAFDSGVPQRSTTAGVSVEVVNANDEEPVFTAKSYEAEVVEHSEAGTKVVTVRAIDKDEGEFGEVAYSLSGELSSLFFIDPATGDITVAKDIDREIIGDIWLHAVATDNAPPHVRKSNSVPVHIKVIDINDNPPVFTQNVYKSTIAENLQLNPPAAIVQVLAEDKDEGLNGKVVYSIVEQSEEGVFGVEPESGIVYPVRGVRGDTKYRVRVSAMDPAGLHSDTALLDVTVLSVNKHAPQFLSPPPEHHELQIPENAAEADYLVTTFKAVDNDTGENGRVSYYMKVEEQLVSQTPEFHLDPETGELRINSFLDRENTPEYQLVVAAVDHGTPSPFETVRLFSVMLTDDNDHEPHFSKPVHHFTVQENLPPGIIIGTVKAMDKDTGEHGRIYYHLIEGNQEGAFSLDRTQGLLRANISFDREKTAEYTLRIYASNNPVLEQAAAVLNDVINSTEGTTDTPESTFVITASLTLVKVKVLDENDNEPQFEQKVYYATVLHKASVNEPILRVVAFDPDLDENGTLVYMIAASQLHKLQAPESSGSVLPSPFNITQEGVVMTATYMAEYDQDRFVLEIIAQEAAPPHRQAKTQVHLWVIKRSSLIRVVVSRNCSASVDGLMRKVSDTSASLLVPSRKVTHVYSDRLYSDWCEVYVLPVDRSSFQVKPADQMLETVDAKYDMLKETFHEYGVEALTATGALHKASEAFDPALAALIALVIALFTGIVTFVVVCACLRQWPKSLGSNQSSKGDSLARRRILEELSTTENPLWLETKLRPYEEQELTMNVFGDQNEIAPGPVQPALTDNTYATIQGSRTTAERFGEYATLGGDPEPPTPLEAALGFQGSTFKPPTPETPEPPPRPTAALGYQLQA